MKATDATIKRASNGYIIEWHENGFFSTIHATFEEAVAHLHKIFGEA
jgi:hypothetical protein